jgi:WhiB family transcriptional regulator, redox-sensing transcriptional regulator
MDREGALIRWLVINDDSDAVHYLARLLRRPEWMDSAACRDESTELFFPGLGQSPRRAREICAQCAVRTDCLTYALESDPSEDDGVWGGTDAKQRRNLRVSGRPQPVSIVARNLWNQGGNPGALDQGRESPVLGEMTT